MKNITPCTVLYCSIDVLGCDCCKKLCGKVKSGVGGDDNASWEDDVFKYIPCGLS